MFRLVPKKLLVSSNSSGFTLIELTIALFVFAIGMLAITAMCFLSIHGNSLANRMTQANFLAQTKMEELLSEVDMLALDLQDNLTQNGLDGNGDAGGSYSRTVDIATVAGSPDTRWITVIASWTDSKGPHQVELKSLARER